ncbi:MAG: hypothetical protein QF619_05130, partial [Candidatus Binatia bacterium]|nr:hypothetical protein [Candidatus Binatia bacterium]
ESFKDISINKVSYLHIDMNNAFAEIEAIKFFWNKIINYGIILLDDYAYGEEIAKYMPKGNQSSTVFPVLDHLYWQYLKEEA